MTATTRPIPTYMPSIEVGLTCGTIEEVGCGSYRWATDLQPVSLRTLMERDDPDCVSDGDLVTLWECPCAECCSLRRAS